ncbi:MAG: glycosyltransferase family 39 protein [Anaerolineales bacterium]|nr:glycosyltransferase family 39 protein [Anaerolineales bacterium]
MALNIAIIINQPPTINSGETNHWWPLILNLIHGRGYAMCEPEYFPFCNLSNQLTASREPVPVLIFAVVASLANQPFLAASIIELGLYLAILLITFLLTRALANSRAALIAALLWAVFIPGLELVPQVSGDLLACLFLTLGMFFLMRARKTDRWRDWLSAGIGMGLGILSRSAMIFILPGLVFGLLWEGWATARKQWARFVKRIWTSVVMILIVLAMLLPWLVRNTIVLGSPISGTTLSGYNLYRHNYMLGNDDYLRYIAGEEANQAVQTLIAHLPELRGTENEAQMNNIYMQEALKVIEAHPVRYAQLVIYRFLPLWFDWQVDEAYGARTPHLDYYEMIVMAFLLITALIAVWKTWKLSWPLWVSIIVYCLAYMAVVGQLRYLIGVMPIVISSSAMGCWYLVDRSFKKKTQEST